MTTTPSTPPVTPPAKTKGGRGRNKPPRSPGRPKGTPNKITTDMREAFMIAFQRRGGVEELVRLDDDIFYGCFKKMLPQYVDLSASGGALDALLAMAKERDARDAKRAQIIDVKALPPT